ncbi:hypothetical protein F4604DRAFT_1677360 [Suillus subluteus]|nr:hypothetical protein F4604DRAFT_1677360 [Suillus subluteus]
MLQFCHTHLFVVSSCLTLKSAVSTVTPVEMKRHNFWCMGHQFCFTDGAIDIVWYKTRCGFRQGNLIRSESTNLGVVVCVSQMKAYLVILIFVAITNSVDVFALSTPGSSPLFCCVRDKGIILDNGHWWHDTACHGTMFITHKGIYLMTAAVDVSFTSVLLDLWRDPSIWSTPRAGLTTIGYLEDSHQPTTFEVWLLGKIAYGNDFQAFTTIITTDWLFEIDVVTIIAAGAPN